LQPEKVVFTSNQGLHGHKILGYFWFLKVLNNAEETKLFEAKKLAFLTKNRLFYVFSEPAFNYKP